MTTTELDPGQSHIIPGVVALRAALVGGEGMAELRALTLAGDNSAHIRLTPGEMILTPQPRRVRMVAAPVGGGQFPARSLIGLSLSTEGQSVGDEEVLVARADLGALDSHELAVVEFAENRVVISVPRGVLPPPPPPVEQPVSGPETVPTPVPVRAPPVESWAPAEEEWLQPGRYALRQARQLAGLGAVGDAPHAWALVLDGSVSMQRLLDDGQLNLLLRHLAGACVEWTTRWASVVMTAGLQPTELADARRPQPFAAAALAAVPPTSWAATGPAVAAAADRTAGSGVVVVVSDGAPGDLARIADAVRARPGGRVVVVVVGQSAAHGLAADQGQPWWQDELLGLSPLAELDNASVVAVGRRQDGALDLDGDRPAQLALRLTQRVRGSR